MSLRRRIASAAQVLFARNFDAASGGNRWPLNAVLASQPAAALAARSALARKASWLVNTSADAPDLLPGSATNGGGSAWRSFAPQSRGDTRPRSRADIEFPVGRAERFLDCWAGLRAPPCADRLKTRDASDGL